MNNDFMKRAIELARQGMGFTSPNPCVGAVIVKGDRIVAEGWHKAAGEDHAEIVAIKEIMKKSGIKTVDLDPALFMNATLYITLEPCCHTGKTSPCVNAILACGFKKVYVGMIDPFKAVNGKSIKILKNKGIDVEVCKTGTALAFEIRSLNQPFIKFATTSVPYVVLKAGTSLDGKIATSLRESRWITSEKSRDDGKLERSKCDAVVIGSGTVLSDDPELGSFGKYKSKKILRVVIDKDLGLSLDKKVFRDENVFVACTDLAKSKNREKFKKANIKFKSFGKEKVSIMKLLKFLGENNIQSVFVEGGSGINGAFYDAALKDRSVLDEVIFYVAPKIIGGKDSLSVIGGDGVQKLNKVLAFKDLEVSKIAEDLKIRGVLNFY